MISTKQKLINVKISLRPRRESADSKSVIFYILIFSLFFIAQTASAQISISEVQTAPIGERFIELFNSGNADVDLTGWYLQRKTTSGSSFGSLVPSTQLKSKIVKANSYFLISRSQLEKSDIVVGDLTLTASNVIRMRDSKGADVDQVEWGTIPDGESYQKISPTEWGMGVPTPGAINISTASVETPIDNPPTSAVSTTPSVNFSSFPVEPQIFADASPHTRIVSTGATAIFSAKVFGLKKEPIDNARRIWSFGDGGRAEGNAVNHIYYYPGDYTVVVDAASGHYDASDRVSVHVVSPLVALHTGGDVARSFVSIENRGTSEVDLSFWQITSGGKTFILPQNTILEAKKTLILASEISGLVTPAGSSATLNFPNGTKVEILSTSVEVPPVPQIHRNPSPEISPIAPVVRKVSPPSNNQAAGVVDALPFSSQPTPEKEDAMWLWYVGIAFLSALALLGVRAIQNRGEKTVFTADDFEIIEDDEPH